MLAIGDIDFENHKIALLHTKNKIQYFIPLSHDLGQVLSEYLAYRKGDKEDILFCTSFGTPLSKRKIQEDVQSYNHARGTKNIYSCIQTYFRPIVDTKWQGYISTARNFGAFQP